MSRNGFLIAILALTTVCASTFTTKSTQAQDTGFICTADTDNIPTTYAQTPDGGVPVFKWTSNYFKPPYTPMQRCQEVTQRMNNFAAQGMLEYLTSGQVNNLPVICAGTRCESNGSNVLLTLKPNQNPNQVLQEIDANRVGAGGPSYQLAGGGSNTSSNSSLSQNTDGTVTLDMNKFLGGASLSNSSQPVENSSPGIIKKTPSQGNPGRVW